MRPILALLFSPLICLAQVDRIGVDPRVELMSVVFHLAGNPEYAQSRIPAYNQAVGSWFAPHRDHEAVRYARQLRQTYGISYDAVMSIAIHVTDAESLNERVPLDAPGIKLDPRWRPAAARRFLGLARDFAAAARFQEFLASQKPLFDVAGARHKALLETADLAWFARFFGFAADVRFEIVSGLLTGSNSYGPSLVAEDGVLEVYAIQGVPSVDAEGLPVLPASYLSNLVHELTHSYTNPLVDRYIEGLDEPGRRLYEAAMADMQAQSYGAHIAVLYETLVRVCTARYALEHQGEAAARAAIDYEHSRAFVWIGELDRVLAAYEADRTTYPSLDAFMPKIVAALDEISLRAADMVASYEALRPKVSGMNFPNGARDVSASITEIAITFDKPMKAGYSVYSGTGAPAPRITKAAWDETRTVFRLVCVLEPGGDYELRLNAATGGSFISEDGYALRSYTIRFRTVE